MDQQPHNSCCTSLASRRRQQPCHPSITLAAVPLLGTLLGTEISTVQQVIVVPIGALVVSASWYTHVLYTVQSAAAECSFVSWYCCAREKALCNGASRQAVMFCVNL